MIYNIITEEITKEQADKLYKYLVRLQNNLIPERFKEVIR